MILRVWTDGPALPLICPDWKPGRIHLNLSLEKNEKIKLQTWKIRLERKIFFGF